MDASEVVSSLTADIAHLLRMNLTFSTRSRFFSVLEQDLSRLGDDPPSEIRVGLGPRGYERDVRVTVRRDDPHTFETD